MYPHKEAKLGRYYEEKNLIIHQTNQEQGRLISFYSNGYHCYSKKRCMVVVTRRILVRACTFGHDQEENVQVT